MKKLMQCALVLGSLALLVRPAQAAEPPKVINVIAVKVKGGQDDAYLQKVKALSGIMKRLETGGTMRVWRATAAGDLTGNYYVVLEYPNLESFGKGMTKAQADPEYTKLVKELDTSGMREMLANSLMVEVTP